MRAWTKRRLTNSSSPARSRRPLCRRSEYRVLALWSQAETKARCSPRLGRSVAMVAAQARPTGGESSSSCALAFRKAALAMAPAVWADADCSGSKPKKEIMDSRP